MTPRITISRIWEDGDLLEFQIETTDGASLFFHRVYYGKTRLKSLLEELDFFKKQIHGGLFDLRMGSFGPEYANGAFHVRFHFQASGKLCLSVHAQSDFFDFSTHNKRVASEVRMYLVTEPALLDRFIDELKEVSAEKSTQAELMAV